MNMLAKSLRCAARFVMIVPVFSAAKIRNFDILSRR